VGIRATSERTAASSREGSGKLQTIRTRTKYYLPHKCGVIYVRNRQYYCAASMRKGNICSDQLPQLFLQTVGGREEGRNKGRGAAVRSRESRAVPLFVAL
jgi:hypothetical protein